MANPWKVIISVVVYSGIVSGCASMRHDSEATNPALQNRTDNEASAEVSEKEAQLRDMKGVVNSLGTRIEALEARLQTMNDRMEPGAAAPKKAAPVVIPDVALIQPRAVDQMGERAQLGQEQTQYQEARLLQKGRKFEEARELYLSFLEQNPDHPWAAPALFHIGETYALQNHWAPAKESFERVLKTYDRSPVVPDALTWLKKIAEDEGNDALVARYSHELAMYYPGVEAATRSKSKPKIQAAQLENHENLQEQESGREPQSLGLDAPPTVETGTE